MHIDWTVSPDELCRKHASHALWKTPGVKSFIFWRLACREQIKWPDCSTLEQIFCFPFEIIEKSVIFIQSRISILGLTLPSHYFFLRSSSKIPLLFFSDFISEHVFLSLISFLYLHCFTNFLLADSLSVCVLWSVPVQFVQWAWFLLLPFLPPLSPPRLPL